MKRLSKRDINMLLVAVAGVILLAAYFFVFTGYQEKNKAISDEITARTSILTELQGYYENLSTYEKGSQESKASTEKNLRRLPRGIATEDFLVYIMDSTREVNAKLRSVSFETGNEIAKFNCMVDNKMQAVIGYRTGASFNARMNYSQLKNYLTYIYEETDKVTFVDSFSVTFDAGESKLETNFKLSKYYITFDGAQYEPVPVPAVKIGIADPFRTK